MRIPRTNRQEMSFRISFFLVSKISLKNENKIKNKKSLLATRTRERKFFSKSCWIDWNYSYLVSNSLNLFFQICLFLWGCENQARRIKFGKSSILFGQIRFFSFRFRIFFLTFDDYKLEVDRRLSIKINETFFIFVFF